jgi:hypothetical protein
MRWMGHVACMGENESGYRIFFLENLKEINRLEAVDERIILK